MLIVSEWLCGSLVLRQSHSGRPELESHWSMICPPVTFPGPLGHLGGDLPHMRRSNGEMQHPELRLGWTLWLPFAQKTVLLSLPKKMLFL